MSYKLCNKVLDSKELKSLLEKIASEENPEKRKKIFDETKIFDQNPLACAIIVTNLDYVKKFIQDCNASVDIYYDTKYEKNMLCLALDLSNVNTFLLNPSDHYNIIAELLKSPSSKKAITSVTKFDLNTPLMTLVQQRKDAYDIVELLINNGVNTTTKNSFGESAFFISIKNGHIRCAKIILDDNILKEYNVINKPNYAEEYPLIVAIKNDYLLHRPKNNTYEIVDFLVSKGANIFLVDKNKKPALHYSSDTYITKLLLDEAEKKGKKNKLIEMKDKFGNTALVIAVVNDNFPIAKLLLENGADANALYKENDNLINIALTNNSDEMLDLLLDYRSEFKYNEKTIDTLNKTKYTKTVSKFIIKKLINFDNLENKDFKLCVASYMGKYDDVVNLIQNGANINTVDVDKCTPLLLAMSEYFNFYNNTTINTLKPKHAYSSHLDIIKFLLDENKDIIEPWIARVVRNQRVLITPLIISVFNGDIQLTEKILKIYKDNDKLEELTISLTNGESMNILTIAAINSPVILELLLSKDYLSKEYLSKFKKTEILDRSLLAICSGSDLQVPSVKLLLETGADPNCITDDIEKNTPLHIAVYVAASLNVSIKMIKTLVENGADGKIENDDGDTPITILETQIRFSKDKYPLSNYNKALNIIQQSIIDREKSSKRSSKRLSKRSSQRLDDPSIIPYGLLSPPPLMLSRGVRRY